MKQAKINIVAGLKASATLAAIVGTRVSDAWPSTNAVYPCVAYLQITGLGEVADGKTIGFDEIYQISCFAKNTSNKTATAQLEEMAEAILEVMDGLGATLVGNSDLILGDNPDVKHKPLRFRYQTRRR